MTATRKPAGVHPTGSQSSPPNETKSQFSGPRCISCKGPGPLRTPTGHPACLDCLIWWNHPMVWLLRNDHPELNGADVADVADVADTGGKL